MTTIEEAKRQAKEAKENISKAKEKLFSTEQLISKQKTEVQRREEELKKQKEKLPKPTQRKLRTGIFSGLMGRQRRRQVEKQKKGILGGLEVVDSFVKDIKEYEKEKLKPFKQDITTAEQKVGSFEKQIKKQEKKISDYELGRKLANKGVFPFGENKTVLEGYRDAKAQLRYNEGIRKITKETGLTMPEFQKLSSEELGKLPESSLKKLESAGLITRDLSQTEMLEIKEIEPLQKEPVSAPVHSPYIHSVDVAPTRTEQYIRSIGEKGFTEGSLNFVGEKLKGLVRTSKYSPVAYTGYDIPVGNLVSGVVQTAPYFSSIGPSLLVAAGTEELLTSAGRERISEQSQTYEQKGFSPLTSDIISWGQPVAEVGLGALGLRGQSKNLQITGELKKLDKTPSISAGYRFEQGGKGVDIIRSYKNVGSAKYVSEIKQPYHKVGEDRFILESGKGVSTRVGKKGDIQLSGFESFGRGGSVNTIPRGVKETIKQPFLFSKPTKISQQSEDLQGSVFRLGIREVIKGKGKIKQGVNFPSGNLFKRVDIKTESVKKPQSEWNLFLGVSKEEGSIVKGASGKADKFKINLLTGEKTIKGKPEDFSIILKKDIPSSSSEFFSMEGGGKKSSQEYFQKLYDPKGYEQSLISESFSKVAPKVSDTKTGAVSLLKVESVEKTTQQGIIQPSLYEGTGMYERTENYESFAQPTIIKTREDIRLNLFQPTEAREKTELRLFSGFRDISKTKQQEIPKQREMIKTKTGTKQLLGLRQEQKQITKTPQRIGTSTRTPRKKIGFFWKPWGESKEEKTGKIISPSEFFKVRGRRYGKDIEIGEFETQKEAEKELKKFLTETLGRSGQIFKGSKALEFGKLKSFGLQYRTAKKDPKRIVQKARFSLETFGERKEIQRAKGKKKKSKKLNWFN
jgi:hypothetical protein